MEADLRYSSPFDPPPTKHRMFEPSPTDSGIFLASRVYEKYENEKKKKKDLLSSMFSFSSHVSWLLSYKTVNKTRRQEAYVPIHGSPLLLRKICKRIFCPLRILMLLHKVKKTPPQKTSCIHNMQLLQQIMRPSPQQSPLITQKNIIRRLLPAEPSAPPGTQPYRTEEFDSGMESQKQSLSDMVLTFQSQAPGSPLIMFPLEPEEPECMKSVPGWICKEPFLEKHLIRFSENSPPDSLELLEIGTTENTDRFSSTNRTLLMFFQQSTKNL